MADTSTTTDYRQGSGSLNENALNISVALFSSEAERVGIAALCAAALIIAVAGNVSVAVIFTVWTKLERPVYLILITYCVLDVCIVLFGLPGRSLMAYHNSISFLGSTFSCEIQLISSQASLLACYHVLTLLSVEQFFYFCRPYLYERYFTIKRTVAALLFVVVLSFVTSMSAVVTMGSTVSPATLSCKLGPKSIDAPWGLYTSACYVCPTVVTLIVCPMKIYRLSKKKVGIQGTNVNGITATNGQSPFRQLRKSVKLILLTSGLFLFSSLPAGVALTRVHDEELARVTPYSGFVAADSTMRLARLCALIMATVSPMFDPWLFLFLHKSVFNAKPEILNVEASGN